MTADRRAMLAVGLWAVFGWATVDGPVAWSIRTVMSDSMGLVPYWAHWAWRVLALVSGVLFALLVPRVWFLAAPATELIDLPLLMYGGPGSLAGFVLSIRREWLGLVALGSLAGWGLSKWRAGRPNNAMQLTKGGRMRMGGSSSAKTS